MVKAQEGKRKDLVKFIAHQTCISPVQIYKLVASLELKKKILDIENIVEDPQPSILVESLTAPAPVAMATKAIEEDWTVTQVREEVAKQRMVNAHVSGVNFGQLEQGKTRDKVGKVVGVSEKTFSNKPQDASESWGFMFPLRDAFAHSRSN